MILVRSPGFEPEYPAWEAGVLTRLDYDRYNNLNLTAISTILGLAFSGSFQRVNHVFSSHSQHIRTQSRSLGCTQKNIVEHSEEPSRLDVVLSGDVEDGSLYFVLCCINL